MPFELRDIAMVKLFFADTLTPTDARALVATVKARSEERVAMLESIRPSPDEVARRGKIYPLLTLELGIAFHQAMVDVCTRFEGQTCALAQSHPPRAR